MKPSVYDTMYITCIIQKTPPIFKNYIIPLRDIHIKRDRGIAELTINFPYNGIIGGPYESVCIGVTDDPFADWAADHGHLGTFRLALIMEQARIIKTKDGTFKAVCPGKRFRKGTVIPDRRLIQNGIVKL